MIEAIQKSIKNVLQALVSKKLPKDKERPRLTVTPGDKVSEDMPHIDVVRASLIGGKTIVKRE